MVTGIQRTASGTPDDICSPMRLFLFSSFELHIPHHTTKLLLYYIKAVCHVSWKKMLLFEENELKAVLGFLELVS